MDDSTRKFIAHLPLPQRVSLKKAAEILEDSDAAYELLDLVAHGLFSWTHSRASGGTSTSFNHLLGTDSELPRVTADTDPAKVFIEGREVQWRWCVRYEQRLQLVEHPEQSTVEAREKTVLELWRSTANTPSPKDEETPEHADEPSQHAATPATVLDVNVSSNTGKAGTGWSLKPSIVRAPGYRWQLYLVLKAAHVAGQPCPKPRDVLEIWRQVPPPEIAVMTDGIKYDNGVGKRKEANLKAIQQAIRALVTQPAR